MSKICGSMSDKQQGYVRIYGNHTFCGSSSRKYLDNELGHGSDTTL
jgi:hypothetical protein